jgi:hypothetical protein
MTCAGILQASTLTVPFTRQAHGFWLRSLALWQQTFAAQHTKGKHLPRQPKVGVLATNPWTARRKEPEASRPPIFTSELTETPAYNARIRRRRHSCSRTRTLAAAARSALTGTKCNLQTVLSRHSVPPMWTNNRA